MAVVSSPRRRQRPRVGLRSTYVLVVLILLQWFSYLQQSWEPTRLLVTSKNTTSSLIPHRLVFTYHSNILQTKTPLHFYDNIQATIDHYHRLWQSPPLVDFYDNTACQQLLERVEPRLVSFFTSERHGAFQGDICRIAALYETGGYYFDIDLRVVEALVTDRRFASVWMPQRDGLFQAFVAADAGSPILRRALDGMLDYYQSLSTLQGQLPQGNKVANQDGLDGILQAFAATAGQTLTSKQYQAMVGRLVERFHRHEHMAGGLVGPSTLKVALDEILEEGLIDENDILLLQETNIGDNATEPGALFPHVERQHGSDTGCNYVVHNDSRVYFFSRILGASVRCQQADRPKLVLTPIVVERLV